MSDPIEDLQNFDTEGLHVNPLPASEVRRRGNRLRHRNNALAAVGGALAVAIIAVPLALGAHGSGRSAPAPVGTPSPSPTIEQGDGGQWLQTIPQDFPLTEGLPATNGSDGSPVTVTETSGVEDLTLCGRPSWSATSDDPVRPVDVAGATYAGESEDSQARTLALYASDEVAAKAIDGLRAGLGFCPADPNGSGATQVYDVAEADLGEESFVFTQRSRDGDGFLGDLSVYQAVRVGNAVYLATTYGEGGANQQVIDYTVDLMAARSAAVISDLCVFAAEPCGDVSSRTEASPAASPAAGEGAVSAIPADFPILDGYPDPSLAEGPSDGIVGPSTDAKDLGFEACGATAPAPDGVDQLSGGWKNPEDYRSRQLTTFATTEAADTFVDGILDVYRSCPTEDTSDGYTRLASVLDGDQGDRAASVVLRYQMQGGFGPGLGITTVVRVGRAVLLSTTYNEGSATTEADVASAAASDADDVTTLVDAMCPWTEQGC